MTKRIRVLVLSATVVLAGMQTAGLGQLPSSSGAFTERTGIAGGLCSFPRANTGDVTLALALAQSSNFVVHLMATNDSVVAALRTMADSSGLLGRSIYVEKGGDGQNGQLPFADRLVDVLVVTDLRDSDLTAERRAEWCRVIAPVRGAALVGCSSSAGAGPTTNALQSWLADMPLSTVSSDASGVWSVIRTNLPSGSEPWTHRAHGADNNQSSQDTTFQAPFLPQWMGMPCGEGFWGTTLISGNGRVFTLRGSRSSNPQIVLTARSLASGMVLWKRSLWQPPGTPHYGFVPGRSCAAVDGNVLYLVRTNGVLQINAETGVDAGFIAGPQMNGSVKWMTTGSGMLAILSGDQDLLNKYTYQTYTTNSFGRTLAVYDVVTSQELWRASVPGGIDERLIARRDNNVYYLEQGVGVTCRDVVSGAILWTSNDANLVAEFTVPSNTYAWGETLISQPALMALDDVLLFRSVWSPAKAMYALSRTNGATLWSRVPPSSDNASPLGRGIVCVAMSNKWITGNGSFDLVSGVATSGPALQGLAIMDCALFTATPRYLIANFGGVRELNGGVSNWVRSLDLKAPCDEGTIVSEGMMVSGASECGCAFPVKGYRTLASAGAMAPSNAPAWSSRLAVSDTNEPALLMLDASDWPTYRHDAQRSGGSAATVGEQVKVLWRFSPPGAVPYSTITNAPGSVRLTPDFLSTVPVTAAGLVWFGTPDGRVRCVTADTGTEVWNFPTAGALYAPPTLWKGRLLVGGSDGYVYCLDASTGRLMWKFRAAPYDRRFFWYGHLVSSWPLFGGVVVQNDIAYTVAGNQRDGGVFGYALNPENGQVIWERRDVGDGIWVNPVDTRYLNPLGLENNGCLAVDSNRLWVASYPRGALDLQTGARTSLGEVIGRGRTGSQFGSQVGVLGNWVIQGGRRLSETQDAIKNGFYPGGDAEAFNDRNTTNASGYILSSGAFSLPVWDAELVVLTGAPTLNNWGPSKLTAVPRASLLARLETSSNSTITAWGADKIWETTNMFTAAYALSQNMVIAANVDVSGDVYSSVITNSHLTAFRRSDGAKAWSVNLPDQPVMGGLAIDRNGRVLVTLCDGSVASIGVDGVPPAVATPAAAASNPVMGTTVGLSVLGAATDDESDLTYTWSAGGTPPAPVVFSTNGNNAAKNTTAIFGKAGAYTLRVLIQDALGLGVMSTVGVTVTQTLAGIVVMPANASVDTNMMQVFTATGLDQFGDAMPVGVSWSAGGCGVISTGGVFTAGTVAGGPFAVVAGSGSCTGTASVTVTPANIPPTVAVPAGAATDPVTGATVGLSVLGADEDGGEPNLTYTWATTGVPPAAVTFSTNGSNAAKNTTVTFTNAGSYGFQVAILDWRGMAVTSAVSVIVAQTLAGLMVAPASVNVITNCTQSFMAAGTDQFSHAMAVTPVWSVTGGGTISTGGLFSAGGVAGGPYTVSAVIGTKTGTAGVTVSTLSLLATYQMKNATGVWVNCAVTNATALMDLWDGTNHTTVTGSGYIWTLPSGGLDIGTQQVYNTSDTNGFKLDLSGGVLLGGGTLKTTRTGNNSAGPILVTNVLAMNVGSINTYSPAANGYACGAGAVTLSGNNSGTLRIGSGGIVAHCAQGTLGGGAITINGFTSVVISGAVDSATDYGTASGSGGAIVIGSAAAPIGGLVTAGDILSGGTNGGGGVSLYADGPVTVGNLTLSKNTGTVRKSAGNLTVVHKGAFVSSNILARSAGNLTAGAMMISGDGTGSLTVNGQFDAGFYYCAGYGGSGMGSVSISNYSGVTVAGPVSTRQGDPAGNFSAGSIIITNGITGNVVLGDVDASCARVSRNGGNVSIITGSGSIVIGTPNLDGNAGTNGTAYDGVLTLTAGGGAGTIVLPTLDLGRISAAKFDAAAGSSITNALSGLATGGSGSGTNGDPVVTTQAVLRVPAGQTISYNPALATNAYLNAKYYRLASPAGLAGQGGVLCPVLPTQGSGTDASGIPNTWKLLYLGATNGAGTGAADDPDSDGMSNYQEWMAGTNPTNASSRLEVSCVAIQSATGMVLSWFSVSDKVYSIDMGTNLMDGFRFNVISNIPATPDMNTKTIQVDQAVQQFYRVRVE